MLPFTNATSIVNEQVTISETAEYTATFDIILTILLW